MATETHIKFDGVDGESTDRDHKGEIRVFSWGWSVSQAGLVAGTGSGKGKATPGDLVFTHDYGKASPVLARKCAQGVHFPTVVLSTRKAGASQKDFLKVTMKEVLVVSVQVGGQDGGDLLESVALRYGAIEFACKTQVAKGAVAGEVKFNWDIKNSKIT